MPSDVADFTGRMATVTGWGRLKYGGGVPSVLQEVQVGSKRKLYKCQPVKTQNGNTNELEGRERVKTL